ATFAIATKPSFTTTQRAISITSTLRTSCWKKLGFHFESQIQSSPETPFCLAIAAPSAHGLDHAAKHATGAGVKNLAFCSIKAPRDWFCCGTS
ncbi:MAG: hypothetical protein NWQ23_16145, partial [Yoonia sp.]|uniref:hypothetical protein n=1 Tax=Yoonia sp. TaxID=2212373 RepID=UPI00273F5466